MTSLSNFTVKLVISFSPIRCLFVVATRRNRSCTCDCDWDRPCGCDAAFSNFGTNDNSPIFSNFKSLPNNNIAKRTLTATVISCSSFPLTFIFLLRGVVTVEPDVLVFAFDVVAIVFVVVTVSLSNCCGKVKLYSIE